MSEIPISLKPRSLIYKIEVRRAENTAANMFIPIFISFIHPIHSFSQSVNIC